MTIPHQDILMYARALFGRRGAQAAVDASEMAEHCAGTGDDYGRQIWSRVAEEITVLIAAAEPA